MKNPSQMAMNPTSNKLATEQQSKATRDILRKAFEAINLPGQGSTAPKRPLVVGEEALSIHHFA
ncbi:hypothetical protein K5D44_03570 [Pseudomonas cichorii]|nr:hypothetical protein [Pseudomonas cichorii]MBX8488331.1 hypothetical protein [Pseudomonas cichorii]MBX8563759.1 hypothetical protein [Pseudomonas cichorii]